MLTIRGRGWRPARVYLQRNHQLFAHSSTLAPFLVDEVPQRRTAFLAKCSSEKARSSLEAGCKCSLRPITVTRVSNRCAEFDIGINLVHCSRPYIADPSALATWNLVKYLW